MKLYSNWRHIVRKSWSLKFIFLAAIFTACEAILPLYVDQFQRDTFAVLTFIAIIGAFVSRLIAQQDI